MILQVSRCLPNIHFSLSRAIYNMVYTFDIVNWIIEINITYNL